MCNNNAYVLHIEYVVKFKQEYILVIKLSFYLHLHFLQNIVFLSIHC